MTEPEVQVEAWPDIDGKPVTVAYQGPPLSDADRAVLERIVREQLDDDRG